MANTRLKKLQGYVYQPANMDELLKKAEEAVEACKKYADYDELRSQYIHLRDKMLVLPTKVQYENNADNEVQTDDNTTQQR